MEEVSAGDYLLTFDGRVLEIFGVTSTPSVRYHARNLEIQTSGPDRKGRHDVMIKPKTRGPAIQIQIQEADWPGLSPFLESVLASTGA